ncbi:MAG: hypothetical protein GC149_07415 [Gammaproteobacteria bacterium]|nr:hypothetical protein [Gammaproteobacteria bacterium]
MGWERLRTGKKLAGFILFAMFDMRKIYTIIFILFFTQAYAGGNPIIGKWKSDKDKTSELIKNSKELNSKAKKVLLENFQFGELVLEISQNKITSYYKGEKSISEYKTLNVNSNAVTIEEYDDYLKKKVSKTIKVKNGIMYIPSSISPSIVEAFVKIE